MKNPYWVSRNGLKILEKQYHELHEEEIETQRKMGVSAKLDNDLRENPEYMELRTKAQYILKSKKRELESIIQACNVIEESSEYLHATFEEVCVGSKVKVEYGPGDDETYTLLGYGEADLVRNVISYLSPLGQSILGKRVGDEVKFETVAGKRRVKIIEIEKAILL